MQLDRLRNAGKPGFLDGQLLIAMPGMPDSRFSRAVIYLCAHSDEGAMGLIVNRRARNIAFPELLVQLNILSDDDTIRLPARAEAVAVLTGGPVETSRGFVLHSTDYYLEDSTLMITDQLGLTVSLDILRAIAHGGGPESALLALGYAGWAAGQLEAEIQSNTWLHCIPDHEILFDSGFETKYDRALRKLGIDPAFLSSEAGHA